MFDCPEQKADANVLYSIKGYCNIVTIEMILLFDCLEQMIFLHPSQFFTQKRS